MKGHRRHYASAIKLTLLLCFSLILTQCKHPSESKSSSADSTTIDTTTTLATGLVAEELTDGTAQAHDLIEYGGITRNEVYVKLSTFPPFESIHELARVSIAVKDSLESLHESRILTDNDSVALRPYEQRAYEALLAYQRIMTSGAGMEGKLPTLVELSRSTEQGDSTDGLLPPAQPSKLFNQGNFFFLGGYPFISKVIKDDADVFYDAKGNPETRFHIGTENTDFLLTSMTYFMHARFTVKFGPPLESYDSGPLEVNGIGTLIHTFIDPVPVLFLTRSGLIKGQFASLSLKIVPQGLGCIPDLPEPEFTCSKNLDEADILGIYIPYKTNDINTVAFAEQKGIWTADLNGDGIADLAGVSSSFMGEASGGVLSEMLWFVNINGVWQIIDWGRDLDCT